MARLRRGPGCGHEGWCTWRWPRCAWATWSVAVQALAQARQALHGGRATPPAWPCATRCRPSCYAASATTERRRPRCRPRWTAEPGLERTPMHASWRTTRAPSPPSSWATSTARCATSTPPAKRGQKSAATWRPARHRPGNLGGFQQDLYNLDDARAPEREKRWRPRDRSPAPIARSMTTAACNLIIVYHAAAARPNAGARDGARSAQHLRRNSSMPPGSLHALRHGAAGAGPPGVGEIDEALAHPRGRRRDGGGRRRRPGLLDLGEGALPAGARPRRPARAPSAEGMLHAAPGASRPQRPALRPDGTAQGAGRRLRVAWATTPAALGYLRLSARRATSSWWAAARAPASSRWRSTHRPGRRAARARRGRRLAPHRAPNTTACAWPSSTPRCRPRSKPTRDAAHAAARAGPATTR